MTQAVQSLRKEWVDIEVNGNPMQCYVARPEAGGPWPAVIVFMEIFGVNSHIREVTERIAAEGYMAIAPNYYHRTTKNMELGYTEETMAEGFKHKQATTREGIMADIRAVITWLQQNEDVSIKDRMGCIGFCFGGHVAFIAAGFNEIAATAAFYGGGISNAAPGGGAPTVTHAGEIKGEIICLYGEKDPLISQEDTVIVETALKEAGVNHEVLRYADASHGFFCNQRADFNPSAAEDAWKRVKSLFQRVLRSQ